MPELGVTVAIIDADRVLLTQREDFEVWCLPGGAVDPGESVAQAALRETREEVGLDVVLTRLVGIYSRPKSRLGGIHLVLFAARPIGGTLRLQPDEVLDAGYFALDALPEPLLWGHRQQIADAMRGASGLARTQNLIWPFDPEMTRQEVYDMRDRSGLTRQQFYLAYYADLDPEDVTLEVGDEPMGEIPSDLSGA